MKFLYKIRDHVSTQLFLPAIKRTVILFFGLFLLLPGVVQAIDIEIMNSAADIFATKHIWVRCSLAKDEKLLIKKGICWTLAQSAFSLIRVYDQSETTQIFSRAFGRLHKGFVQHAVFKILIEQQQPAVHFDGELALSGLLENEDGGVHAFYKNIFIKPDRIPVLRQKGDDLKIKEQTALAWEDDREAFIDRDLRFITDAWGALIFTIKLLFVFIAGMWFLLSILFYIYKIVYALYGRRMMTFGIKIQDIITLSAIVLFGFSLFAHSKMSLIMAQMIAALLFCCGALLMYFCLKKQNDKKLKIKIQEVLAFSCCSLSLPLVTRVALSFYHLL